MRMVVNALWALTRSSEAQPVSVAAALTARCGRRGRRPEFRAARRRDTRRQQQ